MARLHNAVRLGRYEEAAALLAAGADPNAKSIRGSTPLLDAVGEAHLDILRLLLENGAQPDLPGKNGETPLCRAAGQGFGKMVELLLRARADPNRPGIAGHTPLIKAAMAGHHGVMDTLRRAGADPHARSREGLTADEWVEIGGLPSYFQREFPDLADAPRLHQDTERKLLEQMRGCHDPDEYAAIHGRTILIWPYGSERYGDQELGKWVDRVWEVLSTPALQDACEENYLIGEELASARRRRVSRDRFLRKKAEKEERMRRVSA